MYWLKIIGYKTSSKNCLFLQTLSLGLSVSLRLFKRRLYFTADVIMIYLL